MEALAADELLRRVKAGEVTVLDVRPAEEYRAGHLPGALSSPVAEPRTRLKEVATDRDVEWARIVGLARLVCNTAHPS